MRILIVKTTSAATVSPPRPENDPALARWLIEQTARSEQAGLQLVARIGDGSAEFAERARSIAPSLLERLRCPDCRGVLAGTGAGVRCTRCGTRFAGEYGVPILTPTRRPEGGRDAECIRRLTGDDASRARIVRRVMRRLHRNERPAGPLRRLGWRAARRFV